MVTVTVTVPALAAVGTVTVIEPLVSEVIAAGLAPKVTDEALSRLVPVMVTELPPAVGPTEEG